MMKKYIREFSESRLFEVIIMLVVIANTIILSMNGFLNDPTEVRFLESINLYIVLIFVGEMVFKIIGFTIVGNSLDFFITLISLKIQGILEARPTFSMGS